MKIRTKDLPQNVDHKYTTSSVDTWIQVYHQKYVMKVQSHYFSITFHSMTIALGWCHAI